MVYPRTKHYSVYATTGTDCWFGVRNTYVVSFNRQSEVSTREMWVQGSSTAEVGEKGGKACKVAENGCRSSEGP